MKEIRHEKIAELIREKAAFILAYKLQDPRSGLVTITVTRVKLAKDLSQCTIYYSVLGGEKERSIAAHLLKHAKGFIRTEVAHSIETRRSPDLQFEFDDSIEKAINLSKKIDEVMGKNKPNPEPPK